MRRGWVTVGRDITRSTYDSQAYEEALRKTGPEESDPWKATRAKSHYNPYLLGNTDEIEELRPKSMPRQDPSSTRRTGGGGPDASSSK